MDLVPILIVHLFIALILLRAVWHKIFRIKEFQENLVAYQLLPDSLRLSSAVLLILWESVCVVTLLNVEWIFPLLLAGMLFFLYALAMGINLLRGRIHIDCGCGGPLAARKTISWPLVLRNLVLTVMTLLTAWSQLLPLNQRIFSGLDYATVIFSVVALALLYAAIEQAIANHLSMDRWKKSRAFL